MTLVPPVIRDLALIHYRRNHPPYVRISQAKNWLPGAPGEELERILSDRLDGVVGAVDRRDPLEGGIRECYAGAPRLVADGRVRTGADGVDSRHIVNPPGVRKLRSFGRLESCREIQRGGTRRAEAAGGADAEPDAPALYRRR
jgi:hypothetical protein